MPTPSPQAAEATRQLLHTLWERNRPLFLERIAELDRAADAVATGKLTEESCRAAISTAHKLAGSLGMFGYPEGTELARKIEHVLEATTCNCPGEADALALRELTTSLRAAVPL
jgi:HPt (histidine-containing phosphotransfer) domain-containing protein